MSKLEEEQFIYKLKPLTSHKQSMVHSSVSGGTIYQFSKKPKGPFKCFILRGSANGSDQSIQ